MPPLLSSPNIPLGKQVYTDPLEVSALALSGVRATYHLSESWRTQEPFGYTNHSGNAFLGLAEMGLIAGHYYAMRRYVDDLREDLKAPQRNTKDTAIMAGLVVGIYIPLGVKAVADFWSPLPVRDKVINAVADFGVLSLLIARQFTLTPMVINEDTCNSFPDTSGCPVPSPV